MLKFDRIHFVYASMRWALALCLAAFTSTADAAFLTVKEKDELWNLLLRELGSRPRLIFDNKFRRPPRAYGHAVSNEKNLFTIEIPSTPKPGIHVGFGTLPNFNIIAARKSPIGVFAEQSQEVLITMNSFWRSLWLSAESPEEWLAFADSMDTKHRKEFLSRLDELVMKGRISELDKTFSAELLAHQGENPNTSKPYTGIFRMSYGGLGLTNAFSKMYDPETVVKAYYPPNLVRRHRQESVAQSLENISYLNSKNFSHVRQLYLDDQDYYALSPIQNPAFWKSVANLSRQSGHAVSDAYFSNILTALIFDTDFDGLREGLKYLPPEMNVYLNPTEKNDLPFITKSGKKCIEGIEELLARRKRNR